MPPVLVLLLLLIHESYYTMCGEIKKGKTKTTGLQTYLQTSSSHWSCGEQCVFPDQLQVTLAVALKLIAKAPYAQA